MPPSPSRAAPTTVLIVEDEPELLHRFSEAVLSEAGHSLVAAVTKGAAALAVLSTTAPDVLLLPVIPLPASSLRVTGTFGRDTLAAVDGPAPPAHRKSLPRRHGRPRHVNSPEALRGS